MLFRSYMDSMLAEQEGNKAYSDHICQNILEIILIEILRITKSDIDTEPTVNASKECFKCVAPSPGQSAPDGKERDMRPHNGQPRKDIVSDCTKRWGNDRNKVDACVRDAAADHPKC